MASRRWRFIMAVGVLTLGVGMAHGADITVPNHSFDDQVGSDGVVAWTADDWDCAGYDNLWVRNPVDGEFTGSTSPNTLAAAGGDGYNSLHLPTNAGNTSTATTENPVATAEEGTEYTLTVAVGNTGYMKANPDYTIHILIDGVSVASETLDGRTITDTEFDDITVSYTAVAADDGKDIDIRLSAEAPSNKDAWACWDNVRLEENIAGPPPASKTLVTPGQFFVDPPTFENLGFRWYVTDDTNRNASVAVAYREQGSATWLEAQPMLRTMHEVVDDGKYTTGNLFAGSVLFLEPATTYEVRFTMADPDGGAADPRTETVTTRSEPQAWAGGNTINVGTSDSLMDAYNSAQPGDIIQLSAGVHNISTPNLLTNSGEAGKPIVIRGEGSDQTILQGPDRDKIMFCVNADYLIFEDMTIRTCNSFIITGSEYLYETGDLFLDYDGRGATDITVRYCRIEDVRAGIWTASKYSRNWYIADNTITGLNTTWNTYPNGWVSHVGVNIYGQGHVAAYNKISWFGLGLCTVDFLNPDLEDPDNWPVNIDFYGNDIAYCLGDTLQTDYSGHNVRVYRNRLINAYCGLSVQPVYGGPAYFIRNEIYGMSISLKWNNTPAGIFAIHNTVGGGFYAGQTSNTHVYNNLFLGWANSGTLTPDLHEMDYNGYIGPWFHWISGDDPQMTYLGIPEFYAATGFEEHGINFIRDELVLAPEAQRGVTYTPDDFDYRLVSGSGAIDSGLVIPNINEDYNDSAPDLGAIEFGDTAPDYGPREHAPAYEPLPGDADYDDEVTLLDFIILKANFGTRTGATWSQGDFNGDGAVDLQDFSILKANFGTSQ